MISILAASQLLSLFADYPSYFEALYESALATVTGFGFSADTVFVRILHVVLAIFSVVVFATLAGAVGVFFLPRQPEAEEESSTERSHTVPFRTICANRPGWALLNVNVFGSPMIVAI